MIYLICVMRGQLDPAQYLTIIPRARMDHKGERNNFFSKIQLLGQKYRDKTTLPS